MVAGCGAGSSGEYVGRVSVRGPGGRRSSLVGASARPVQSTGAWGLRDGPSSSMSSVFVDLAPLKDVLGSVPERFRGAANDSGRSAAHVAVARVTTW